MSQPVTDHDSVSGDYQHHALLHGPRVQRAWHQMKLRLLEWFFVPKKGDRVIDIGCGSGVFADRLGAAGATVLAIDPHKEAIAYGKAHFERPGVEFRQGSLVEIAVLPASFDRAICLDVIEHVPEPELHEMLRRLRTILRPGGLFLVATPNYRGLWPAVEWTTDRLSPAIDHHSVLHVTRFHRRLLRKFLEDDGFEVVTIRTCNTFAPFVAALSFTLARGVERLERVVDLPFGNLLIAIARNPAS